MTWLLTAKGEADPEREKELQEKLNAVLADAKYGTTESQLWTESHNGPVHVKPAKPDGRSRAR